MKKFENKVTEITNGEVKMTYCDFAVLGLNNPPQGGFTVKEMKFRMDLISKFENVKPGDIVKLEEDEFDKVYETKVKGWNFMHKDIINYDNYLEKLNG